MFTHNLKITLRNLRKHKLQSTISIVGLAVGFVCFSLSFLWLKHEMSYDNFHPDAERIYIVRFTDPTRPNGLSSITPYPLAGYLEKTFPEIKAACTARMQGISAFEPELVTDWHNAIGIDSSFLNVFNIQTIDGNLSSLINENDIIITSSLSRKLCGNTNCIGYTPKDKSGNQYNIKAVIDEWPQNTNIPFEIIQKLDVVPEWNSASYQTYIKLKPNTDATAFSKKLSEHKLTATIREVSMEMTALTTLHYTKPNEQESTKFSHILFLFIASVLVIICSLLNYLTLFINFIYTRGKELAIRKANGASNSSLSLLLGTDFLFILLLSVLLGGLAIEWIFPGFKELAGIKLDNRDIYIQIILYVLTVISVSVVIVSFPVIHFQRKTLQQAMLGETSKNGKNLFRKTSIAIQLIISIGFIFCTAVFIKQIYHLNHTDLGFERRNIGRIQYTSPFMDIMPLVDELRKIPSITDVLKENSTFLRSHGSMSFRTKVWDDKKDDEFYNFEIMEVIPGFFNFYEMKIIQGKGFDESTPKNEIVINEAAAKQCGWINAIGKNIYDYGNQAQTVIGVVKDFYIESPGMQPLPIVLKKTDHTNAFDYKYREGTRKQTEEAIGRLLKSKNPDIYYNFSYMDDVYRNFCKSEQTLMKLLGFLSLVCVIIAIFGIFSLVTLTCEQRRKEIAIRKINGASIHSIMSIFIREYIVLLAISGFIAFPAGYIVMKPWLEQYVKQTTIDWWVYASILFFVAVCICFTILSQVWKTAHANPAEVIKSE